MRADCQLFISESFVKNSFHIVELGFEMESHSHSESVRCPGPQDIEEAHVGNQGLGVVIVPYFRVI